MRFLLFVHLFANGSDSRANGHRFSFTFRICTKFLRARYSRQLRSLKRRKPWLLAWPSTTGKHTTAPLAGRHSSGRSLGPETVRKYTPSAGLTQLFAFSGLEFTFQQCPQLQDPPFHRRARQSLRRNLTMAGIISISPTVKTGWGSFPPAGNSRSCISFPVRTGRTLSGLCCSTAPGVFGGQPFREAMASTTSATTATAPSSNTQVAR